MPTLFDENNIPRPTSVLRPGLVHLPDFLSPAQQHEVVSVARECARRAAGTPFAMTRRQLKSGKMSAYLMSLGQHWEYSQHRYVSSLGAARVQGIPELFEEICLRVLAAAAAVDTTLQPWVNNYDLQAALVNYYPPGSGMGMHQDDYETCAAPVISLCIGDTALFRAGNTQDRNKPWDDIALMSGDALVFGGPARAIFHGLVRLEPDTAPSTCGLEQGRINVTFRQVS